MCHKVSLRCTANEEDDSIKGPNSNPNTALASLTSHILDLLLGITAMDALLLLQCIRLLCCSHASHSRFISGAIQ